MLFLQTKFVKGNKILHKNYFVIFTNFRLNFLKKIAYKTVYRNFFFAKNKEGFSKV